MQVGDLVIDRSLGNNNQAIGMIVTNGFYTDIGTPFDWGVFYFVTGDILGVDSRYLEVV
tara:strand:+ start:3261 stop:3437 length:177 start_codon:yes stop_codon:yes gene_type:complete